MENDINKIITATADALQMTREDVIQSCILFGRENSELKKKIKRAKVRYLELYLLGIISGLLLAFIRTNL